LHQNRRVLGEQTLSRGSTNQVAKHCTQRFKNKQTNRLEKCILKSSKKLTDLKAIAKKKREFLPPAVTLALADAYTDTFEESGEMSELHSGIVDAMGPRHWSML
jgi:hypothetical protein